ncbi:type II secretion system protein [Candidatus Gracilibacteria bacterium]|jgi:prepilin-type N-terminal cleavage/methylation domain-containing protein|nr:type II secretion system protein [Candidatus Gracilibacteria bacterium]NJM89067.1 type II secretion system protein [Hydrococcus sp. RU_2_2]NJP20964.1 type II secretion system protein [Hydrococcus sp. CRU_1_1]NJQ97860.1 type II secretion system protein [Hydrococcus sp. CSU_1_8]
MKKQATAGFTLLEMLAVVTMVGILAAIAVPSWLGFINRQQLNTANDKIYQAMRQAQSRASQQREAWQVSIRQSPTTPDTVEWAVYKSPTNPDVLPSGIRWEQSANSIQIDAAGSTLPTTGSFYRMVFNYKGCPVWSSNELCTQSRLSFNPIPQLNLSNTNTSFNKRCVMVTTRLGAIATGADEDCN